MSNSTSDSGGLTIRILHSPNSCCLSASLLIGFRCWSMSSCKQLSVPLCFCPSSSLVTLKRFAIKTPPFLALATPPQQLAPPASHQCGHLYVVVLSFSPTNTSSVLCGSSGRSRFFRFCHMYHTACTQLFVHSPRSYALVSVQLSHLDSNKKIHHIISIELQRLKYGLNLLYCSMFKHYPLNFIKCINKYSFDVL